MFDATMGIVYFDTLKHLCIQSTKCRWRVWILLNYLLMVAHNFINKFVVYLRKSNRSKSVTFESATTSQPMGISNSHHISFGTSSWWFLPIARCNTMSATTSPSIASSTQPWYGSSQHKVDYDVFIHCIFEMRAKYILPSIVSYI